MKRMVLLLLVIGLTAGIVSAQKLIDIYKNGPVKLVADKDFGAKNNWESLFSLYYDTITENVGKERNKKIVVAPDGSVFLSHRNRYEIWKFGPDGNFIKRIGSKGGKPGQFIMMPYVQAVIGNKYVLTSDVGGRLNFFDLNGNYIKTINLKYTAQAFQPLNNDNILLFGFAVWKSKIRNVVVRLNINSGNEEILYDYFTNSASQSAFDNVDSIINAKKGNFNFRIPGGYNTDIRSGFTFLHDGKFIRSDRNSGDYTVYNPDGKELLKARMEIEPVKIGEADVQKNYEMMKSSYISAIEAGKKMIDPSSPTRKNNPDWSPKNVQRQMDIYQKWLDNIDIYRDIKNYYPFLPCFSNIISDDEGNLLVFEYTNINAKEDNIFNVVAYDIKGQKLARTSFICDDYDLSFSDAFFVISKGYACAFAKLKNTTGMPLRLVKFRITN
jgi:hypothetical protein